MDLSIAITEAQRLHRRLISHIEDSDDAGVDKITPDYDRAVNAILAYHPRSMSEFKLKANFILSDLFDEYEDDQQINLYCDILKREIDDLIS
jgi:hypothetical protein